MNYNQFISPREITIGDNTFMISKIPALQSQEIYSMVIRESLDFNELGLTMLKPDTIKRILAYTAFKSETGSWVSLELDTAINGTFKNLFDMHRIVLEMIRENYGFFLDGSLINSIQNIMGQG